MRSDGHRPDEDELGPVDYLAVEFPGGRITAPGFDQLMSLVRQGTIRILDAEFVVKDPAGSTRRAEVGELDGAGGADLSAWAGASSGLLDEADLGQLAAAIEPGSAAAVIVYENRWVLGLADTWRREGARLIADGGISADDLVDALDATERSFLGGDHVGILKTAATVAVASSVHGRVQRRQQQRWAAQDQPAAPAAPPPQVPAPAPSSVDTSDRLAQLTQLGDLKNAGVLTEAEFEREKARILNG